MKVAFRIAILAAVALALSFSAYAGDEMTVTGKILCAKCTLKKADAKECQNVLVVEGDKGTTEYYLVKNDVTEKYGHVCMGEKGAVVTGTVMEKDGKTWLTATKMAAPEKKG